MHHSALLTEKDVAALLACKPHVVRRLPIKKVYLQPSRKRKARYTQQAVNAYLRSIGAATSKLVGASSGAAQSASQKGKRSRKNVTNADSQNDRSHWSEWTPPNIPHKHKHKHKHKR